MSSHTTHGKISGINTKLPWHQMKNKKNLFIFAFLMLFVALVGALFYAVKIGYLSPQMALLLLICLLGMYVGFGILFGAYRLVSKLH